MCSRLRKRLAHLPFQMVATAEDSPMNKKLFTTGLIGTVIAALCCFTPILVILLGALGLSAIVGWLDYVLLPALGIFVAITVYALVTKTKETDVT